MRTGRNSFLPLTRERLELERNGYHHRAQRFRSEANAAHRNIIHHGMTDCPYVLGHTLLRMTAHSFYHNAFYKYHRFHDCLSKLLYNLQLGRQLWNQAGSAITL